MEKPSDGEIYCKIRQYERLGNLLLVEQWKALLSDHRRKCLRLLSGRRDGKLAVAFDDLLDIPGLWEGMRISTLHTVMALNCDEEVIHYLKHIKEFWHRLLHGDNNALRKVDQATVKALELKSPRYSRRDARVIQGLLMSGQIFAEFSRSEREVIWGDLRSVDGLIPSLFTFFEDLRYLTACAGCLKRLVNLSRQDTVYTAFQRSFTYPNPVDNQYTLEVAESTFVVKPGLVDRLNIGYRHMWLYAMRHYREIPTEAKKKLLAKVVVERADENILSALAFLANKVGFESAEIYDLKQRSSDNDIARNALLKARRPDQYQYSNSTLEASVAQIVSLFDTAVPVPCVLSSPSLASDSLKTPENRCGFPDEDSYEQDQTNGRDQEVLALVEEEGFAVVEQEMNSLVEEGGPAEMELEMVERVQQERFVQEWIEQEVLKQEA
ncbi:hypothetical protein O988_01015 [Pseudogymnoascus sp. VKM F-3808]|nr:hypothetical protein O988_01015 [Pseudogymnoascus sp. VKM F-3808]